MHRGSEAVVWDPVAGGAGRRLGVEAVSDTHGDVLVGCPPSSGCRELVIIDVATGGRTAARPGPGHRLGYGAELSPDGSVLAAPVAKDGRWRIALVHTADGTVDTVRGSHTGEMYPDLSWSESSGWLFFRKRGNRLGAIHPSARRAVELPFRLPRGAFGFAAG